MLACQNFRGSHNTALVAILRCLGEGQRANDGFAAAHIALQNAVHGLLPLHIFTNFPPRLLLLLRQGKGQIGEHLL